MPKLILNDFSETEKHFEKKNLHESFAKTEIVTEVFEVIREKFLNTINCPTNLQGHEGNVLPGRRDQMVEWFKHTNPNSTLSYSLSKDLAEDLFKNKMDKLKPAARKELGLYAHLRKQAQGSAFAIILEPVFFDTPNNGQPIQHITNQAATTENEYFLLDLAHDSMPIADPSYIKTNYPFFDDSSNKPVTKKAFIPYGILKFFYEKLIDKDYEEMKFELARNAENGKITFIISFQKNSTPITSIICDKGTGYEGMLMDDHDLIPPPDIDEDE